MANKILRAWLVSPVMRKCTELNSSVLLMDNAGTVLCNMRTLFPDAQFAVCTNECPTIWTELGLMFNNGKFFVYAKK